MTDSEYDKVLIQPILASTNMGQVRARARASRTKVRRLEDRSNLCIGDAVDLLDEILKAEITAAGNVITNEWIIRGRISTAKK